MTTGLISQRIEAVLAAISPFNHFITESTWAQRGSEPAACDFVFGNPHEMPLPGFVDAVQQWSVPQNKDWCAYKGNEPTPRAVVAATLRERRGLPFEEDDIFLTDGAFAALAVTLAAITNPGDEVIFISPPWFFYEALIMAHGAHPIRVKADPATFDLDLKAIDAVLNERTRAMIINSPHNPTGKIYPPAILEGLARILTTASGRTGHPIFILSDEAYSRIIFDGRNYHSPANFYPNTFLLYTYGKTLLTPGQRLGYIALPPTMPHRELLRAALFAAQLVTGYAFPNALLQHALPDLENLSIDVGHL
jgi:aspartate aminotransferase